MADIPTPVPEGNSTSMLYTVLQVLAGLVIVYIIYVLALLAMRADKMMIDEIYDQGIKREVPILKGVLSAGENASSMAFNQWNTSVPYSANYLPIRPSVNLKGGAQFTYSFWLYVGLPADAVGKTILLKGDKKSYKFTQSENKMNLVTKKMEVKNTQDKVDRVVMCPMIAFGAEEMEFEITFNTFHNMHEKLHVKKLRSDNNVYRNNLSSLFPGQWMRLTIVFEDNVPINDFEDGLSVRFYINDVLYQTGKYATALRQNKGDMFLFPDDIPIKDCKISDMKYYNYALSDEDVRKLAQVKPNLQPAASANSASANLNQVVLSDFNKLDVFNT